MLTMGNPRLPGWVGTLVPLARGSEHWGGLPIFMHPNMGALRLARFPDAQPPLGADP